MAHSESPQSTVRANRPRIAFTLRTLLLLTVLVALAAAIVRWQGENNKLRDVLAAHGLAGDRSDLSADNFRLSIRKLAASTELVIYEVVIETRGERPIAVEGEASRSQINIGTKGELDELIRCHVTLAVDLLDASAGESNRVRFLAQVGNSHGTSAGGPATLNVPKGKTLDELFELLIKPGIYPRGQTAPLCRLDGAITVLKVD